MNRDDINKVADWMMQHGYATGHGETMEDLLDELKWQIDEKIAIEREACAALCEAEGKRVDAAWVSCATAIRARGQR